MDIDQKIRLALEELKRTQAMLSETVKTGEDICANLAVQREQLNKIRTKVAVVDSSLDQSRSTLINMIRRNKFWWVPWF